MSDGENIVLEHRRHIRGAIDGVCLDILEIKHRVGAPEQGMAQVHVEIAGPSARIDRLSDRIERVDKPLDLTHA